MPKNFNMGIFFLRTLNRFFHFIFQDVFDPFFLEQRLSPTLPAAEALGDSPSGSGSEEEAEEEEMAVPKETAKRRTAEPKRARDRRGLS